MDNCIFVNKQIDISLWNTFVKNKIFFRFEWLNVIQNSYNLDPLFVLCYKNNKFALIASFKTTKGYISLPFVSYSGFLSNDEDMLKELKNYLKEKNLEIDSRDLLEETNSGYVNPIVTINSFDDFWKSISSNNRNQFKKSEKSNFIFKEESSIDYFYSLYSLGMRNLGTPVHSKKYFFELMRYFNWHIFTIFVNEKAIGSMFCLHDDYTLAVLYAYVNPRYSKQYANYFLYLNAIKWMCENNLKYLDMGRSNYGEGTFHFKKKFRPKFYGINSKINYSSNKKMQIASKIWQRLPFGIANFIGPKVRKYLP